MPSSRKPKQESVLRVLGRTGARPINSQAQVVAGVTRQAAKANLQQQLKGIRTQIRSTADPALLEQLEAKAKDLHIRVRFGAAPHVDQRAISKAAKALERAQWERANRRGKK
jgi:hypothetical protein